MLSARHFWWPPEGTHCGSPRCASTGVPAASATKGCMGCVVGSVIVWAVCCSFSAMEVRIVPGVACNYFLIVFSAGFQNMDSCTKLTAKDATDAKTPANSTSRRPESDGRRHGPGFGPKSGRTEFIFIWLTRAI